MSLLQWLHDSDPVARAVAAVLLAMSVASWVAIAWKMWMLQRARYDVNRSVAAFWQSATLDEAMPLCAAFDRLSLVQPLLFAIKNEASGGPGWLGGQGDVAARATRALRGALQHSVHRLQFGQVLLATVASTSPFVGLLGTVWGIRHALGSITGGGQITIDRLAGPVGEALVMTAAGLSVAIPAVLAYNLFGRSSARIEESLEGFAHDLREWATARPTAVRA